MTDYYLSRPGICLAGDFSPNVPVYPTHYLVPKIGDVVYVVLENKDEYAIDTDTISNIVNHYDEAMLNYEHQKSIGMDPVMPLETDKEKYLIDFWLTKYGNGHGNCFGETIYSSFLEAKNVLAQFYSDHVEFNQVLNSTEEELKP